MTATEQIVACIRAERYGAAFSGIATQTKIPKINLEHALHGMLNRKELELHGGRYRIPAPIDPESIPKEVPMAETKRCSACGKDKPIADFYNKHGRCKPCYGIRQKAREALKPTVAAKSTPKAAAARAEPDLELPAAARISLHMADAMVELRTDPDITVAITPSQMDVICTWWKSKRAA